MRNTAKGATGHITSIAAVFLACGLLAAATLGCGLTAGQNAGPDTKDEMRSQPDPSLRHQEAKRTMLEATNRHRAQAGAPPLRPGLNPAAQLHAEAALVGCYAGHWDRWGLKPGHRYALAGGEGAQGENAAGSDYCIRPRDRQPSLNSLEDEAERTVQKWMESEGHRLTLLDPAYTVMHAGIAHDQSNLVMIQQLSSEYVKHTEERGGISCRNPHPPGNGDRSDPGDRRQGRDDRSSRLSAQPPHPRSDGGHLRALPVAQGGLPSPAVAGRTSVRRTPGENSKRDAQPLHQSTHG